MNVGELAKESGKTIAEIKEITGLTHHKSKVDEKTSTAILLGYKITDPAPDEPPIENTPAKKKPESFDVLPEGVTAADVWHAWAGRGSRSPLWPYRHLGVKPEK